MTLWVTAASFAASSTVPSSDSILGETERRQELIRSLAGNIIREIIADKETTAQLQGKFYWQSPCFRFDFHKPEETSIIYDGQRLVTRRPAEHEATVKEVPDPVEFQASTQTPWLPAIGVFRRDFAFELVGQGPVEGQDVWVLEGSNQDTGKATRRVMIWIDRAKSIPWRVETYGAGEGPTTIYLVDSLAMVDSVYLPVRFSNWVGMQGSVLHLTTHLSRLRLNEPLTAELFKTDVSEGPGR
jgi:outer membrane lipoprotein-sorting protein